MKTLQAIALSLFSLILTCSAGVTSDLVGTWKGTVKLSVYGMKFTEKVTVEFKKYQRTGLRSKYTILLSGSPETVGLRKYKKTGKVFGKLQQGSDASTESGTWNSTKRSITSETRLAGTSVIEVAKFRLLKGGKLRMISSATDGYSGETKLAGILKRR